MATIKSTFSGKKTADEILRNTEQILSRELQFAVTDIVARTQQGRDVDGGAFKPYSESYAAAKTRPNAKGQSRGANVNLTFTGKMLAAMQSKVERVGSAVRGIISFDNADEAVKAKYNQETRKFFGLSRPQIDRINKALNKIIRG